MAIYKNNPPVITDGLVLYLDAANKQSYPGTGTVWNDLSGNRNSGTLVNGPTFDNTNGGSLVFDGVNDYVNINSVRNYIVGSVPYTINILIKINSFFDNFSCLLGVNTSTGGNRLLIGVTNTGQLNIVKNGVNEYSPNSTILTGQWYHITTTNTSEGIPSLYVNGVYISSINNISTIPFSSSDTWTIAAEYDNSTLSDYLDSNIVQTSIYNRALTQEEILQNYNATKSRFNLT